MSPEEHKKLMFQGDTDARNMLTNLLRHGVPFEGAESYLAGMLKGAMTFVTAHRDEKAAFDMMQRAADGIDHPQLKQPPEISG